MKGSNNVYLLDVSIGSVKFLLTKQIHSKTAKHDANEYLFMDPVACIGEKILSSWCSTIRGYLWVGIETF